MAEILITIEGEGTVSAAQELLAIPGISGTLVAEGKTQKRGNSSYCCGPYWDYSRHCRDS